MNLYDYYGKNVIIIDAKGNEYRGKAVLYESALDNDDGENPAEESLGVLPYGKNTGRDFFKSEIKSIEIDN